MDTDTHNALLNAILANPEADLPRLVYADFLEENDWPTGICQECNGVARVTDREQPGFIGACPPLWWHTAIYDARDRVTYCQNCQGSGKGPNRFAERAEFIRLMCDISSGECVERIRHLHNEFGREWFPTGLESSLYKFTSGNPSHVVTRGFISEVRCSFAWWTGSGCPRCNDTGLTYVYTGHGDGPFACTGCHGTGRTPAHGPQVMASHPVAIVMATGVTPFFLTRERDHREYWGWFGRDSNTGRNGQLPPDVWLRLTGCISDHDPDHMAKWYFTREAATSALSAALIAWAKAQKV